MSKTKRSIDKETLNKIFLRHGLGEVEAFSDLKGGMFNSVLKVTTKDGESYAVKIAPANDIQVLTYEKNLIKSEVYFYEKFAQVKSVHFPKVFGYDCDENSDYRYIIMEFVEGTMLSSAKLNKDEMHELKVIYDTLIEIDYRGNVLVFAGATKVFEKNKTTESAEFDGIIYFPYERESFIV